MMFLRKQNESYNKYPSKTKNAYSMIGIRGFRTSLAYWDPARIIK